MPFQVYNTLTRAKETFEPIESGVVRMYNCGPTVYGRQHIGNFRSFLFADLLRRWFEHEGYEVRQVMNITDVGHLTDEVEGEGEDKIEARARREGLDPWEISRQNTELFLADMTALGVREPMARPKATDYIPQMLAMIEALIEKGHAYRVGGDVYFDVSTFEAYGRLSGNRVEDLEAGARIAVREEKRNPADFALWKSDPRHVMKWESVFGPDGFPGWHVECSTMAIELLGETIDVHTGGEDNVFPHHECEIAQSECFTGKTFVRYWMHAKFLQVDGGKMAKSLGNVYSLDDVIERGFEVRHLRHALIRGHYRQPLNFTWEVLEESRAALEKLDDLVVRLRRAAGDAAPADPEPAIVTEAKAAFQGAMNDDLATPDAFAALFTLRNRVLQGELESDQSGAAAALALILAANEVLGVICTSDQAEDPTFVAEVEGLIAAREQARIAKDWAEADRLRDALTDLGVTLEDASGQTTWRR